MVEAFSLNREIRYTGPAQTALIGPDTGESWQHNLNAPLLDIFAVNEGREAGRNLRRISLAGLEGAAAKSCLSVVQRRASVRTTPTMNSTCGGTCSVSRNGTLGSCAT